MANATLDLRILDKQLEQLNAFTHARRKRMEEDFQRAAALDEKFRKLTGERQLEAFRMAGLDLNALEKYAQEEFKLLQNDFERFQRQ